MNLICAKGRGTEGTELMLDKTTGVKGALKTLQPWSKGVWEGNDSSSKEQREQDDKGRSWSDSTSERKNCLKK